MHEEKIAVIGLGYVGLPLAIAFAKKFSWIRGFDINQRKVRQLQDGVDVTGEIDNAELAGTRLKITSDPSDIREATVFIVTVPTPVDKFNTPDLTPVINASECVGSLLKKGDLVIYESTVYPGVTEEICGPILAKASGLRQGTDFKLGYSPERVNPGDKERTVEKILKVVSAEDPKTLERVTGLYGKIIVAGIHRAPTIKVAEAAKVIENTQRDINIAFMNELAILFDRMGIRTKDVLEAAKTKWNFLSFEPGLVGGHCIGVDPYYLTAKAEEIGYNPQVILAGRRINDSMGQFVAQKTVKMMMKMGLVCDRTRVAVLGMTFKENVTDIRNSRVPDILNELRDYGISPSVCDPHADSAEVYEEYGFNLTDFEDLEHLDVIIIAVAHKIYKQNQDTILKKLNPERGILIDVKSAFENLRKVNSLTYWSL
ncbi:MAG: nucleotide sugar dehydrogenase [Oligoflexales bacterium]|nr:nucleotide sugar dehydrogenase [Oligoflexales bacterium]